MGPKQRDEKKLLVLDPWMYYKKNMSAKPYWKNKMNKIVFMPQLAMFNMVIIMFLETYSAAMHKISPLKIMLISVKKRSRDVLEFLEIRGA